MSACQHGGSAALSACQHAQLFSKSSCGPDKSVESDCHWERFVLRGMAGSGTGVADMLTSEGLIGPKRADKAPKAPC